MRTAFHAKRIQAAVMNNAYILAERSFILAVHPEKGKNIGRWLLIHFASPIAFFYTIPKIQRRIYYNVPFFITYFGSWWPCVQQDVVLCYRRILVSEGAHSQLRRIRLISFGHDPTHLVTRNHQSADTPVRKWQRRRGVSQDMPVFPPTATNSSPATKHRWTTTPNSYSPSRNGTS